MNLLAPLGTLLLLTAAAHDIANAHSLQTNATAAVHSGDCFSKAYAAARRAYRQHYKADWYVKMRAVVEQERVTEVEMEVGPYDGSVGGSIGAKYRCSDGAIRAETYER